MVITDSVCMPEGSTMVLADPTVALVVSISAVVPSPVKSGIPTEFFIPSRVDDASAAVSIGAGNV